VARLAAAQTSAPAPCDRVPRPCFGHTHMILACNTRSSLDFLSLSYPHLGDAPDRRIGQMRCSRRDAAGWFRLARVARFGLGAVRKGEQCWARGASSGGGALIQPSQPADDLAARPVPGRRPSPSRGMERGRGRGRQSEPGPSAAPRRTDDLPPTYPPLPPRSTRAARQAVRPARCRRCRGAGRGRSRRCGCG